MCPAESPSAMTWSTVSTIAAGLFGPARSSKLGHHAEVHRALLLIPVIHPLESAERTNQSAARLEVLLIAMNAFGEISCMDHGFVGTRVHIRSSFRCVDGTVLSAESAAGVQH